MSAFWLPIKPPINPGRPIGVAETNLMSVPKMAQRQFTALRLPKTENLVMLHWIALSGIVIAFNLNCLAEAPRKPSVGDFLLSIA